MRKERYYLRLQDIGFIVGGTVLCTLIFIILILLTWRLIIKRALSATSRDRSPSNNFDIKIITPSGRGKTPTPSRKKDVTPSGRKKDVTPSGRKSKDVTPIRS
jgi:hypothetical protein